MTMDEVEKIALALWWFDSESYIPVSVDGWRAEGRKSHEHYRAYARRIRDAIRAAEEKKP